MGDIEVGGFVFVVGLVPSGVKNPNVAGYVLTRNSHIPNLRLAYTRFQGDLQNMYIYMLFCLLGMRSKVHFNTLQYIPSSSFVPPKKKRSHKSSCFSSNKSDEGICTKATVGIRDKQFDFYRLTSPGVWP